LKGTALLLTELESASNQRCNLADAYSEYGAILEIGLDISVKFQQSSASKIFSKSLEFKFLFSLICANIGLTSAAFSLPTFHQRSSRLSLQKCLIPAMWRSNCERLRFLNLTVFVAEV